MPMQLKVGECYKIGLTSQKQPTVTCGTGGIACMAGVYSVGSGKWLVPLVAYNRGKTGIYTFAWQWQMARAISRLWKGQNGHLYAGGRRTSGQTICA